MPFSDIVAVIGLLLTLTTFMFNLAWSALSDALALDEYQSGPQNRRRNREKVGKAFYSRALPLTCAFVGLFYVNLPSAIRILSTSTLDLWNFDVSSTLYVMVVWVLLVLALFSGLLAAKIALKWRSLR